MKAFALPRLRDVLFFSIFFAAILLGPRMLNTDGDLPHYLAVGKYILQGHLPTTTDIFSYTRFGVPFAPHKWLSGVLFYIAYWLFDERGIVLLSALLLAATFAILFSDGVKRTGTRLPILFLVGWGAAVTSIHWIARPHLFSMLLFTLWLVLTERLASGQKVSIWLFAGLMLLWNNIHGEFIAGFLVTGAALAGWLWEFLFDRPHADKQVGKRLGLVSGIITVVTLANPVSLRAISTVTNWMGNDYLMSHTEETIPPNFAEPKFFLLMAFLIFSIFMLAIKRGRIPARMGFILAIFTAMVLFSARNVHYYGIAAPFVLAGTFSKDGLVQPVARFEALFEKIEGQLKGILWPALTLLAGIAILLFSPVGRAERFSPAFFPVQATEWLKTNPQQGNMFNPFNWGGYISLELWPKDKVFIDSQGDIYGEAFIREYEKIISLNPGWQATLEKYQVQWAFVPVEWNLAAALKDNGWQEAYRDHTAVILVKGE
jgi:hypothetical protein